MTPSETPQNLDNNEELYARIAQLQSSLQAFEGLESSWNEQWQRLLLVLARWQIVQGRAENTVQELSQPLAAITNYAGAASQLLNSADSVSNGELQRVLGKLADQVTRAGDTLRTMRNEIRQIGYGREVCDLGQVVTASLALHSRMLQKAGVHSELQSNANRRLVSIDTAQIHLALKHLIQNAVESLVDCEAADRKILVQLD